MFRAAIIADYEAWQAWFVATGEKTSTRVNRESCRKHVRACVRVRARVRQVCVRATGYWQTLAFLGGRSDSFNGGGTRRTSK